MNRPSIAKLRAVARGYNLDLDDEQLHDYQALAADILQAYDRLDVLPEPALPVAYERDSGSRPLAAENPHSAWAWRCEIEGGAAGLLAGKRVAIKDNVAVAGLPMMNGTRVLEGFVPGYDATIVTRILEAGGRIVGKTVCESLCFSGGSHTSEPLPVLNPVAAGHSAGGSSSGSAVVVATGAADMAIGGDQGGSIRIPSSWTGVVGLKPTYGLVPYTGAFPVEMTLDHVGPMAASAADCALLLEAIAGPDGLDPRQAAGGNPPAQAYSRALTGSVTDLRIGILQEGFGQKSLYEQDVDDMVRAAAEGLADLGATVTEVSVPWHLDGPAVWTAIVVEGATAMMVDGNSMGTGWQGHYSTQLLDVYGRSRVVRADDLPATVKLVMLAGQYMHDSYQGRYYAKAQNLARVLRAAYDEALAEVDILMFPTIPMKAPLLPSPECSTQEWVDAALKMNVNTCCFNVTGHPALSLPVGTAAGLPVGMSLIGRHGDDATLLRAADAFERASRNGRTDGNGDASPS